MSAFFHEIKAVMSHGFSGDKQVKTNAITMQLLVSANFITCLLHEICDIAFITSILECVQKWQVSRIRSIAL